MADGGGGFDFGRLADKLFNTGIDVWADSEKSRNYSAGVQTVATRDAAGNSIPAGQPGMGNLTLQNPLVIGGIVLVAVIVLAAVLKR